jgi:hypothetical protein
MDKLFFNLFIWISHVDIWYKSNTVGATSEVGTTYSSRTPKFPPGFFVGFM